MIASEDTSTLGSPPLPLAPPALGDGAGAALRSSISQLLGHWSGGERRVAEEVLPLVYAELHKIAEALFRRERRDHTLQATALIHEAYLRLIDQHQVRWQNRSHFYAVAACMMRRVLVDHSRERRRLKRGGEWYRVTLGEAAEVASPGRADLLDIDAALERLSALDPMKGTIVELRFFGGLGIEEIAGCLGVAPITVSRHWRRAKAWLYHELSGQSAADAGRDPDQP